jgi:N-acetylglucosaminyldiphosphoundecaprenol N-acetyl-beta-D-mannosaminyltransferase
MMKTHHGYFSIEQGAHDNLSVLKEIEEYAPNLLLIGMGMPRQEYWILENYDQLKANAILTAGACMDYVAGNVPTPPRWMGRTGLEWLYRLLNEPKRLWKRYLVEPWYILGLIVRYKLNLRSSK